MLEDSDGSDFRIRKIAAVYRAYQEELRRSSAMDFDDIIMKTVELLQGHEDVRKYYQRKFRYVCVDEYQDTNYAQFVLTSLLAGEYRNLMVVGDDDQSIYKFRGATIENILNFDKVFGEAKVIKLEQNYRSTGIILDAANAVIANNVGRKGKNLWTAADRGEKITVKKLDDQNGESRYVADVISRAVASGKASFKDFAVLYRNNAQSSGIERTFAKSAIPYRMLGGLRFNDRKEIRDIVAYLHLIANRNDRERLLRIINMPRRKIGERTLEAVEAIAAEQSMTLFDVMAQAGSYVALQRSASILLAFARMIEELSSLVGKIELPSLIDEVLDRSGYPQMLIDAGEEERERLENLDEFKSNVIEYCNNAETPTLTGFLEENALVADVDRYDDTADAVVLMTIHSAKGLEFPIVFLPGMEDGIFPGMQTITGGDAEMEEERRLAYVAITRAKRQLYILHAKTRLLYGSTAYNPVSRFVSEIPTALISNETEQSPSVGGFSSSGAWGGGAHTRVRTAPSSLNNDITVGRTLVNREAQAANRAAAASLAAGDRVQHATFGLGTILSARPMAADTLLEVAFDNVGTKKLMATYAKLKKI
jgi:DNA helicase-2/ATP-dependent DNA helicase PcrA